MEHVVGADHVGTGGGSSSSSGRSWPCSCAPPRSSPSPARVTSSTPTSSSAPSPRRPSSPRPCRGRSPRRRATRCPASSGPSTATRATGGATCRPTDRRARRSSAAGAGAATSLLEFPPIIVGNRLFTDAQRRRRRRAQPDHRQAGLDARHGLPRRVLARVRREEDLRHDPRAHQGRARRQGRRDLGQERQGLVVEAAPEPLGVLADGRRPPPLLRHRERHRLRDARRTTAACSGSSRPAAPSRAASR